MCVQTFTVKHCKLVSQEFFCLVTKWNVIEVFSIQVQSYQQRWSFAISGMGHQLFALSYLSMKKTSFLLKNHLYLCEVGVVDNVAGLRRKGWRVGVES